MWDEGKVASSPGGQSCEALGGCRAEEGVCRTARPWAVARPALSEMGMSVPL